MFDAMTAWWVHWLLLAFGAGLAFAVDRLARLRRADRDSGDLWAAATAWCLYPLAAALLLSWLSPLLGGWPLLYLDRAAQADGRAYSLALLLPFGAWASVLAVKLLARPSPGGSARWLAGRAGFAENRRWTLWPLALLGVPLALGAGHLGGGEHAYPAVLWSSLAVAALSLAGVALSSGRALPAAAAEAAAANADGAALKPWPPLLEAAGLQVHKLAEWPAASEPPRILRDGAAQNLAARLESMGACKAAPELLEAAAALLHGTPPARDGYGPGRVVFAPDGCGQAEAVGLLASQLDRQHRALTLVIAPRRADALAGQLRTAFPDPGLRIAALGYGKLPEEAAVWVADAALLSDHLLPRLKDSHRCINRMGLVVWWQLHEYSGVMAANLWAITRRLHRLLRSHGREDLLTLALLRGGAADAQTGDFVRHLLPHAALAQTHVEPRPARPLSLHSVQAKDAAATGQYLLLRAAAASVAGGWPTAVEPPEFIAADEFGRFLGQAVNGEVIRDQLRPSPERAGARLLRVEPADVLALPNCLSQSGREADGLPGWHVGLMSPTNPYAAHLLDSLQKNKGQPASRRLICARSCPAIIKRHLLLGLNELPDTREGLLQNSLWDLQAVDETLNELARLGKLDRQEVRYLDVSNRLSIDFEYRSRVTPDDQCRPLDTVGVQLINVRERAGGGQASGIRLRVDPERLLIEAYPGRVFMQQGQRYRINDWFSVEEVERRGELDCHQEGKSLVTWRRYTSTLYGINPLDGAGEVAIGHQGRLMRLAVELSYEEEVTGRIEWTADPCQHWLDKPQFSYIDAIANRPFKTQAILLRLMAPPDDANALPSLCQALRHVLPVHLGVEDDALAVVSLNGDNLVNGEEAHGVAVVDLYPGGIGLVEAVRDDDALWLGLLQSTRQWLERCREEDLQQHPAARAASADQLPQPEAALSVLRQIL